MAPRGVHGTPYRECLVILGWALENWEDVRGRLIECQLDLHEFDAHAMIDLFFKWYVDDFVSAGVSRAEARDHVLRLLRPMHIALPSAAPTAETWGLSAEARASQQSAMEMFQWQ